MTGELLTSRELSMKALILAVATALPSYYAEQQTIGEKMVKALRLPQEQASFVKKVYQRSAISKRYSVVKDIEADPQDFELYPVDFGLMPSTQERNDIYVQEAPKLAMQAAIALFNEWNRDPQEITHIISVSCTGVMAPGIEFLLHQQLNLSPQIKRIGINFMGCFGAFTGLMVAAAIAEQNPLHRVLLVCTELCSLHLQMDVRPEVFIGNILFGDGAGAVLVGCQPREGETPLWSIEKLGSYALKESVEKMTWTLTDEGFAMYLDRDIPKIIEDAIADFAATCIGKHDFANYTWAIHPGGKAIVQAIERACSLRKEQTAASWQVLDQYGNMSSATFLFVLKELSRTISAHQQVLGLAFGPGLSIESIVLKGLIINEKA